MIEFKVFATFSLRFIYVFISEVGIAAAIHLNKYIAAQATGDSNKNKDSPPQVQKFSLLFQALCFLTTNCEEGLRQTSCDGNVVDTCFCKLCFKNGDETLKKQSYGK